MRGPVRGERTAPWTIAAATALTLAPSLARAYDFAIDAQTVGQAYQLRAADATLVNRRRLTQYLGLDIYNLGPRDDLGRPKPANQFYLSVSLRFDGELGDFDQLDALSGRTPQHDLVPEKLDLLYAYVGGRDVAGFLDFELGRQIRVDLFDWTSFDGLHVQARSRYHVAAEAWGGLSVTGAEVFDSPLYRVDGTASGGGNPFGSLDARQQDALQPTFGVALRSLGLRDLDLRVSYDRTMSPTQSPQPGEPDWGVIEEKVGVTARGRVLDGLLVPWFALRYDLLVGRIDEVYAGVRAQLGRHQSLTAEYVLAAPTFDGDSIWNVFASQAFDDARLAYDVVWGRLRAYARLFARFFHDDLGRGQSLGGNAGARVDLGRGWVRLDGYYEDGYGGRRGGVDGSGSLRLCGDVRDGLFAEGRLSYADFRDDLRAIDHADSFGVQGGLRYTPTPGVTLHGLVEENVNRLYKSQLRALALLDLSFYLGQRPRGRRAPAPWSGF